MVILETFFRDLTFVEVKTLLAPWESFLAKNKVLVVFFVLLVDVDRTRDEHLDINNGRVFEIDPDIKNAFSGRFMDLENMNGGMPKLVLLLVQNRRDPVPSLFRGFELRRSALFDPMIFLLLQPF